MSENREVIIESFQEDEAVESIKNIFKYNIPVNKVCAIAKGYIKEITAEKYEDNEVAREHMNTLVSNFVDQNEFSGDADDFHNFAVELAQINEFTLACKVLQCALSIFPRNVDLLSDYLYYGVKCSNKFDECKKIYKTLKSIPCKRWTWRGYTFSIEYLKVLVERSSSEKERENAEHEMLELAKEYARFFPYSEDSYRIEAEIYNKHYNDKEKELEILNSALETLKVAPRCALRCADILFERGEYSAASKAIKRGISDATQTKSKVNEGYIYYLSALCKIAETQKNEQQYTEEVIDFIFSNFNIALQELGEESYREVITAKTNIICSKCHIEVEESKYSYLYECMESFIA